MIKLNKQTGMTLIELLIGIALSGLIFLASSSLLTLLFASSGRNKQIETLEQAKSDLQVELSNVIRWSSQVSIPSSNRVLIRLADGTTHEYRYDSDKKILKDGLVFTPDNVSIKSFTVIDRTIGSGPASPKSLEIIIELEHSQFPTVKDHLRIVVSQRVGASAKA